MTPVRSKKTLPKSWADRMEDEEPEIMDYGEKIYFSDEDDDPPRAVKLREVSEKTRSFLSDEELVE